MLVCVLLIHVFVCLVRVSFSHLSLPLGVGGWLRFVIVALLSNYIHSSPAITRLVGSIDLNRVMGDARYSFCRD